MILKKNIFVAERSIKDNVFIAFENEYYCLDKVGYDVWKMINGEITVVEIIKSIAKKYKIDFKRAETDVSEFIQDLINNKLVKEVSS